MKIISTGWLARRGSWPLLVALATGWVLPGCAPESPTARTNAYYDLAGFAQTQIARLDSLQPAVEKTVTAGGVPERRRVNRVAWERELSLFLQADLNKPAYLNSYVAETFAPGTVVYRAKTDADVPVRYLLVETDAPSGRLLRAEAQLISRNYLYYSEKNLVLHCGLGRDGRWLVRDYAISGFQQLAFFKPELFGVKGKIL